MEERMSIYLGNLLIRDIEKRLGIEIKQEHREWFTEHHQSNAHNIEKGKWHCFDIPFTIVCGDMETAVFVNDALKEFSSQMKTQIGISIDDKWRSK